MLKRCPAGRRLWALALLAPLAACGGDELPAPAAETAPPPAAEAPPPPTEMMHATIVLDEVNSSGVSGEAMAMHSDDAVVVILDLDGLTDEGEYAAHIHIGSCAEGGPVAVSLNPVLGLADGTGTSTTTLEADELTEGDPHFIMVHGEGGTPIVCGDLEGHGR
ncbi:MAG: hypothetical protein EA421_07195 [Gemmatimonadales bacterium]|jgi:hypothetical protein|nr:MAG: hypothetical protein EA421_07195 [Gemmatimonadales bacterium]